MGLRAAIVPVKNKTDNNRLQKWVDEVEQLVGYTAWPEIVGYVYMQGDNGPLKKGMYYALVQCDGTPTVQALSHFGVKHWVWLDQVETVPGDHGERSLKILKARYNFKTIPPVIAR